jgi:hypothetical protein
VLFYHGVEKDILDPDVQRLHMPLHVFEKQVTFLRRHREVISMDYLYECVANRYRLEPRHVVLTFDDGYKNNLHTVAPLLQALNLPFTIFISTRHISEGRRFATYYIRAAVFHTRKHTIYLPSIQKSFDVTTRVNRFAADKAISEAVKNVPQDVAERITGDCLQQLALEEWAELNGRFFSDEPMSWADVTDLRAMAATIGSHCHDHCILHANQPNAEVCRQLKESKKAIEQHVDECKYMSYPSGTIDDISPAAYSAVKSSQFRMGFSTIESEVTPKVDNHIAPRIWAVPEYEEFCYTLSRSARQNEGYYDTCRRLRLRLEAEPVDQIA